jgi:tetratricopeptide (TPR) repeat protein
LFFLSQCLDAFHGSPLSLQLDWLHFAGFFMYVYLSKKWQERSKAKLGDPELLLLKALEQDCKKQPLIFIDTYERLQAAQELNRQKISSLYSQPHQRLKPVNATLTLQDWLDRLLEFLQQSGAVVVIAGRRTGHWRAQDLQRFNDEDIANVVGSSDYADLQALLVEEDSQCVLLSLLKRLSFDGIPLWLQLALNFVSLELSNGSDLVALAAKPDIHELFATPEMKSDLSSANIEHANCKLALFKRVMQHNLELENEAWKMALPRRLSQQVLALIFAEQADAISDAFTNAGLMPTVRWSPETNVALHEEIRDLLLAYSRYQGWLDTDATKAIHKQLATSFDQHYQATQEISYMLERLYHSLMSEDITDLEPIKEPKILLDMAVKLQAEKQYAKMAQVMLRLIAIQADHVNAWYGLGVALAWLDKLEEAVEAFQQQLTIAPNHKDAGYNLGVVLYKLGKLDEALQAFRQQLATAPNHEQAWNGLGNALRQLGKLDEEVEAYRQQLEIKPDHEHAWNNLAIAYWHQGNIEQAQQAFAHALELNPQDLFSLSNDAELALVQNDKTRCRQRINSVLALVDNKTQQYVILPFLAWLTEPENAPDAVYQALEQLDNSVKIAWNFADIEPVILRLTAEQQAVARQFIASFQRNTESPAKPSA